MSNSTHRTRILLLSLAIYVLSGGMAEGVNQIRLGCPATMNPIVPGDSVTIPVYIMNDATLNSFSMGFTWNDPHVRVSSTDLTGSALTPEQISNWHEQFPNAGGRVAAFSFVDMSGSNGFAQHLTEVFVFSMNVVVLPGATESCVNFDSAYVWPAPFRFFPVGANPVDPDYVDCGTAEIVLGNIHCSNPPIALCHDVTVSCDNSCQADAAIDNGSYDPDSGDTLTIQQEPPGPYFVGTTAVTLFATDNHGISSHCHAAVHVLSGMGCPEQNYPPVAICHDVFVTADAGTCYADAEIDNGSFDPDSGCSVSLQQVPAGPYPTGSTLVHLYVKDCYGVAASSVCDATVHVLETIAPTISCPSDVVAGVAIGQPGTIVHFPVTASDMCTSEPTIVATPPSGSFFPVGTTSVTAIATDISGNADTCRFDVLVQEVAFICGDANDDEVVDIADAVYLIKYIFSGGPAPSPWGAGDTSCDSAVDIADAVYLITYIFRGGPRPCEACD